LPVSVSIIYPIKNKSASIPAILKPDKKAILLLLKQD